MAMVSSLSPSAALLEDVLPSVHESPSEKSSWRMTSPRCGRKSGVGDTCWVGIYVGVGVEGNQSTVAVGVGETVAVGDSSVTGGGVSEGRHAARQIANIINPVRILHTFARGKNLFLL